VAKHQPCKYQRYSDVLHGSYVTYLPSSHIAYLL